MRIGSAPASSLRTVNYEMAILRRGFRLAAKDGKVGVRPEFSMLHVDNARKGFFELEHHRAIQTHLPDYLRPVAAVAYITGWRTKSEILTREWRHVDLDNGWLRLEPGEGKNREGRAFPFTDELRMILEAQRERVKAIERTRGCVIRWAFCHPDGSRINDFCGTWAQACDDAKVPRRLVHDFRRTAVRNLERAGISRSAAMKMTGHKTEAVYRRYAIVDSAMLRRPRSNFRRSTWQRIPRNAKVSLKSPPFRPINDCSERNKRSIFKDFPITREWRNGRRAGLRIQCRKAWGFKSPLSHQPRNPT